MENANAGRDASFSLIVPFYADAFRLRESMPLMAEELAKGGALKEVLLCQNGRREQAALELPAGFRHLHREAPGIGEGYASGIAAARSEWCLLSASDLPFGFGDWAAAAPHLGEADLFIGSKLHPDSKLAGYGRLRLAGSRVFYLWRRLCFGAGTPRDSQGTILVRTELARELCAATRSRDFSFAVEFVYRAQRAGRRIREVPVTLRRAAEDSSVSFVGDGQKMFRRVWDLARERS